MTLRTLLRYNSRHSLYLEKGRGLVLNPIVSRTRNADGTRTRRWDEPLWLYHLRQRIFAFAGRQRCGRRDESHFGRVNPEQFPDTWDLGPDGNRTCSYCGSIHFEDLMAICRRVVDGAEGYELEGTTKGYKVYIRQPGVVNASQGAIKFYKQHAPRNASAADQDLFAQAMRVSHERLAARYSRR